MDRKPPKLHTDERATLLTSLQYCRDCIVHKVEGLDDTTARGSSVDSGISLMWLVKHLAYAERIWILGRFLGDPARVSSNDLDPDDTLAGVVAAYERTWAEVDAVVAAAGLDDVCVEDGDDPVNLRWILVHLIEETARHAGHADILREQIDGRTGR